MILLYPPLPLSISLISPPCLSLPPSLSLSLTHTHTHTHTWNTSPILSHNDQTCCTSNDHVQGEWIHCMLFRNDINFRGLLVRHLSVIDQGIEIMCYWQWCYLPCVIDHGHHCRYYCDHGCHYHYCCARAWGHVLLTMVTTKPLLNLDTHPWSVLESSLTIH